MNLPEYITKNVSTNYETGVISVHTLGIQISKFAYWYTPKDLCQTAHIWGPKKLRPKKFYEQYRVTTKQLCRWINAAQYKLWIHGEFTRRLALRKDGLSAWWTQAAHNALPHLVRAKMDGLDNLLPIIAIFNDNPHNIKKMVGKGAWVKLSHNSFTRNLKLACRFPNNHSVADVLECIDIPSTVLTKSGNHADPEMMRVAINQAKTYKEAAEWLTEARWANARHVVRDTIFMARNADEPYNLNWSFAQWQKKHDKLSEQLNRKRYGTGTIVEPHEFVDEENKLRATRLTTPMDIALEGSSMHHCVASYIQFVREGHYLVYSIRDMEGNRVATLGLRRLNYYTEGDYDDDDPLEVFNKLPPVITGFRLDQIYAPCNQPLEQAFNVEALIASL